jgi:intein-encoded DNA endonuclease-like protein
MNDLLRNINKIHTTEFGIIRIKKNIELKTDDIINWCKKKTKNADEIIKNGKNWYVYNGNNIITINAKSYTIITAHKVNENIKQPKCRKQPEYLTKLG